MFFRINNNRVKFNSMQNIRTAVFFLAAFFASLVTAQVGHVLEGIGPIANGMGTAVTGNPLDPCGALYWNSAGLTAMPSTVIAGGIEIMMPHARVASTVGANAFGPGMPAGTISGTTCSKRNSNFIPGFAFVYKPKEEDARWAVGLGMYGTSGFGVEYDQSMTNPVLTPQAPAGLGFGQVVSNMAIAQVCPTFAYKVTKELSVGVSPIFDYATLNVDPFPGTTPDDANGDGYPSYPNVHTSSSQGGGFQVGMLYRDDSGLRAGLSFKSRQWFKKFDFVSHNEMGAGRRFSFQIDYPMIISGGVGYSKDKWDFDVDLRYFDYKNTAGFDESGYSSTGAVKGFGWDSIWEVATGMQYHVNDKLILRTGYIYNENPIPGKNTFFNLASPAIIQHHVSVGLSYMILKGWMAAVSYTHGFKNSITGPYQFASGPVANTSVNSRMSTDIVIIGTAFFF